MLIDVSAEEVHPEDLFTARTVHERKLTVIEKRFVLEVQKYLSRALPDEAVDAIESLSLKFTGEFQRPPDLRYQVVLRPAGFVEARTAGGLLSGQAFDSLDDDTMLGIVMQIIVGVRQETYGDLIRREREDYELRVFMGGAWEVRLRPGVDLHSFL